MPAPLANPRVNGSYYQFTDVETDLDGVVSVEITAVDYKDTIDRGEVRGARRQLLGRTRGEYKAEASIEMLREAFDEMTTRYGDGWMDRAPFQIRVSYGSDGQPLATDTLVRCRFKDASVGLKQGTDPLSVKLELDVDGVLWNGKLPFAGFER